MELLDIFILISQLLVGISIGYLLYLVLRLKKYFKYLKKYIDKTFGTVSKSQVDLGLIIQREFNKKSEEVEQPKENLEQMHRDLMDSFKQAGLVDDFFYDKSDRLFPNNSGAI